MIETLARYDTTPRVRAPRDLASTLGLKQFAQRVPRIIVSRAISAQRDSTT